MRRTPKPDIRGIEALAAAQRFEAFTAAQRKAAEAEREACARLLESFASVGMTTSELALLRAAAAGIRARGNP